MAIALTLAQIIELSGGRPRRMRQFANEGIIQAQDERLGRSARVYPISEAAIACIVARLDTMNIQSGALAGIADYIRSIYRVPTDYNFKSHKDGLAYWAREVLLKMDAGDPKIQRTPENKKEIAIAFGLDEFPRGAPLNISTDELHRIRHWTILEKAREGEETQSALHMKEDGSWTFWLDGKPGKSDDVDVYIVLNLHRILSVLK
jgi:hypothetical protein